MQYYQRLRDIREDYDKTQAEIAALLGLLQTNYSRYERGDRELPMHHFMTLARYYNISLDYLSGLTNEPRTLDGRPFNVSKNITITQNGNGHFGQIHIKN